LTNDAWQGLVTVADEAGMSQNDYLEALAQSCNSLMETVGLAIETDIAKIAYQPNSEVLPFIKTVRAENQPLHIELGNCASEKEFLNKNGWKFNHSLR
jgi:hypothetical protein